MPPVPVAVAPALPDKHGLFSGNPSRRQPVRPPRWQIQASLFPVPANTWRDYLHDWNQTNRARSQNRHMPGHPYRGSAPLPLALTMPLSGVLSINPYLGTAPTSQKHPVQTYILVLKLLIKRKKGGVANIVHLRVSIVSTRQRRQQPWSVSIFRRFRFILPVVNADIPAGLFTGKP